MSNTDTPRTDAFRDGDSLLESWREEWELAISFAKGLERELTASRAEVERLHNFSKRILWLLDSDLPTSESAKFWDEYESQYGKIQ